MSTGVRSSHWSCLPCYFQLLLDVGVQNCSSPSVSLSPSIAKTLLSLFATVISPSRRLLRNAVSLQLWNGSYAIGMPSVVFFHACYMATCAMHLVPPLTGKGRWCCELLLAPDRALIQVSEILPITQIDGIRWSIWGSNKKTQMIQDPLHSQQK